jgi:hypothetical protein
MNRYVLLQQMRKEHGVSDTTEILIDYIEELWEAVDLLKKTLGDERAQEIIHAPSLFTYLLDIP